jgi:NADH-quinone oxidoreductase subunit L
VEIARAAAAVGIFHLFNHASFKALLFLGSGSANHATGTFDMRLMGGLKKTMPWTYITFVIGSLSLAGIWPLAGFWSKDEIVAKALEAQPVLGILALITVFMTAFYMFRAVFMTFHGEYKGGDPSTGGHTHESPKVMIYPMLVLAALAVFSGFWNTGGGFSEFMGEEHVHAAGFFGVLGMGLPWLSLCLAGLGILLAYAMYIKKWISAEKLAAAFKPVYTLFLKKYWFDELYENIIVRISLLGGLFKGFEKIDTYGVDGAVNGVADTLSEGGAVLRKAQTGQLQLYGLFIGIGILAIVIVLYLAG